jgi:hypothetical protein
MMVRVAIVFRHRITDALLHTIVLAVSGRHCRDIGILSMFPDAQGMLLLGTVRSRKESCGTQNKQG